MPRQHPGEARKRAGASWAADGPHRERRAGCGGRRPAAKRQRAPAFSKAHLARRPWTEIILCQNAIFRLIKMVEDLLDLHLVLGVDEKLIRQTFRDLFPAFCAPAGVELDLSARGQKNVLGKSLVRLFHEVLQSAVDGLVDFGLHVKVRLF